MIASILIENISSQVIGIICQIGDIYHRGEDNVDVNVVGIVYILSGSYLHIEADRIDLNQLETLKSRHLIKYIDQLVNSGSFNYEFNFVFVS